jgi:hypothetical protein
MPPIFLTKQTDTYNTRQYLWPLIPDRSLVITEHIVSAREQISKWAEFCPEYNGQTIYYDLSQNPEVLESPHITGLVDELKQHGPVKIIANHYKKYYKPESDYIFYPAFFHSYSHSTYIHGQALLFPTFEKKIKPFMSLNHRAVWHRIWLFIELAKHNLLDKIEYTFFWDPKNDPHNQLDQLPNHKREEFKQFEHLLPRRFDAEKHDNYKADITLGPICHHECAVNIVTESCPNLGFLTEKICKPLASYQIPILLSHAGATQFCQDAGFDMFEDIVPWRTWDLVQDDSIRYELTCKFITDYITHGDALADWHRCQHRVIANRERLTSDEFKKFCVEQFKL